MTRTHFRVWEEKELREGGGKRKPPLVDQRKTHWSLELPRTAKDGYRNLPAQRGKEKCGKMEAKSSQGCF